MFIGLLDSCRSYFIFISLCEMKQIFCCYLNMKDETVFLRTCRQRKASFHARLMHETIQNKKTKHNKDGEVDTDTVYKNGDV